MGTGNISYFLPNKESGVDPNISYVIRYGNGKCAVQRKNRLVIDFNGNPEISDAIRDGLFQEVDEDTLIRHIAHEVFVDLAGGNDES